jgi:hypothetical protein
MADYGYVGITSTCPVSASDGDTDSRIFGKDGDTIYRNVVCPEGHTYTIEVDLTVEGAVTEYVID